jgi:hypothetical protein
MKLAAAAGMETGAGVKTGAEMVGAHMAAGKKTAAFRLRGLDFLVRIGTIRHYDG